MADDDPFATGDSRTHVDPETHVFGGASKHVCRTELRGHETPRGRSLFEIVVDASEGFIPLWAPNSVLRYRFNAASLSRFRNPSAARSAIRQLFGEALVAWGDAAPVRFHEARSRIDFEIFMRNADDCDGSGCVLASAFFPDSGKHRLTIYPKMFKQPRPEQVETLVHEIGHIFGLRHFFAQVSETSWASQIFGAHNQFSIMNYGAPSILTDADRADLKSLYRQVWAGTLLGINGTPIRQVKPFSASP